MFNRKYKHITILLILRLKQVLARFSKENVVSKAKINIFVCVEQFYLCRFYSNMAICKPTLFLLTVKEILLVHFIITNFRLHTKCCVHLGYEILDFEIAASAASHLGDNFSLGSSKYDFAALIYK
jgi:hypothetical protein